MREFDVGEAADAARGAFWARGYAATSVDDLRRATGLSTGSLYKAFGDKAGLHREGLRRYLAEARAGTAALLSDDDPTHGLRAWLATAVDGACTPGPTGGCYSVLAAAELASTEVDVAETMREHDRLLVGLVRDALRQVDLRAGLDPERGARLLLTVVKGLQVTSRAGIERVHAQAVLDDALDAVLAPT